MKFIRNVAKNNGHCEVFSSNRPQSGVCQRIRFTCSKHTGTAVTLVLPNNTFLSSCNHCSQKGEFYYSLHVVLSCHEKTSLSEFSLQLLMLFLYEFCIISLHFSQTCSDILLSSKGQDIGSVCSQRLCKRGNKTIFFACFGRSYSQYVIHRQLGYTQSLASSDLRFNDRNSDDPW